MEVVESQPIYSALNGDEWKRLILADAPAYLEDVKRMVLRNLPLLMEQDYRFRISRAYHKIGWKLHVDWEVMQVQQERISWAGEVNAAHTLIEENQRLKDRLDRIKKDWNLQTELYRSKLEREKEELLEAKTVAEALVESLKKDLEKFRTVKLYKHPLQITEAEMLEEARSGIQIPAEPVATFTVTMEQPPVEEPDRLREKLAQLEQKNEEAAEQPIPVTEEPIAAVGGDRFAAIGRSPQELANLGTDGQPAPVPVPANSGAVVGGGKRPSSVVGKPK